MIPSVHVTPDALFVPVGGLAASAFPVEQVLDPLTLAMMLVGCFGFAYIVGHSTISFPFRLVVGGDEDVPPLVPHLGPLFIKLLECPACLGFWQGFVLGALGWFGEPPFRLATYPLPGLIWCIALGCVVSGSNFIIGRFTRLID